MSKHVLAVKHKFKAACNKVLHELDLQERKIEGAISELVTRKANMARKREVFASLMKKSQLEHTQTSPTSAQNPSEETTEVQSHVGEPSEPPVSESKPSNRTGRYKEILRDIADQVTSDTELPAETDRTSRALTALSALAHRSKLPDFPKVRGDTYNAYRFNAGKGSDFEQIPRYNEYFTQPPVLSREPCSQPIIYILDTIPWPKLAPS